MVIVLTMFQSSVVTRSRYVHDAFLLPLSTKKDETARRLCYTVLRPHTLHSLVQAGRQDRLIHPSGASFGRRSRGRREQRSHCRAGPGRAPLMQGEKEGTMNERTLPFGSLLLYTTAEVSAQLLAFDWTGIRAAQPERTYPPVRPAACLLICLQICRHLLHSLHLCSAQKTLFHTAVSQRSAFHGQPGTFARRHPAAP